MKHLGDVTKIDGGKIEPVDIITFGSPCQDLSVAGKRAGLEGERSGLFSEAVRIIREMQRATAGKYPRLAIWENVPGAFSSQGGADFAAVLESLVGCPVCVPEKGWTRAGVAFGPNGQAAWRTFDAQFWGVPQRRRRIFLVADFAGECAGEILFEQQGMSGDITESGEAREEIAEGAGDGIEKSGQLWDISHRGDVIRELPEGLSPTLTARMGTGGLNIPITMSSKQQSLSIGNDIAHALRSQPSRADKPSGTTYVIQSATMGGNKKQNGLGVTDGPCYTLDCRADHAVAYDPKDLGRRPATFEGVSPTLKARCGTGGNNIPVTQIGYRVRRLTPLECERLQGFPDGWTDIPGGSDTARYKALGNSVAIPCVEFIMRRIKEVLGLKTLGSLFDGIAGFPLAASRHGITTLWASEIELFCIRVSSKHFPEEELT